MNLKRRSIQLLIRLLLVCFVTVSFQQAVFAGMVTTADLISEQGVHSEKQRLQEMLSSDRVQSQLIEMGVSPDDAKHRLANMTDEEVATFASKMDDMQAGSGVIGALVLVFVILLVTDLLGYTDVFPFVKKTIK